MSVSWSKVRTAREEESQTRTTREIRLEMLKIFGSQIALNLKIKLTPRFLRNWVIKNKPSAITLKIKTQYVLLFKLI